VAVTCRRSCRSSDHDFAREADSQQNGDIQRMNLGCTGIGPLETPRFSIRFVLAALKN